MKDKKTRAKQGAGRPPAGRDETGRPVPVSTAYVKTTLRLRPSTKAILDALAQTRGKDRSSIVDEALSRFVESLPPQDQALIGKLEKRK